MPGQSDPSCPAAWHILQHLLFLSEARNTKSFESVSKVDLTYTVTHLHGLCH